MFQPAAIVPPSAATRAALVVAAALIGWAGTAQAQTQAPASPADLVGSSLLSDTCATLHGSGNGRTIHGGTGGVLVAEATPCFGQAVTDGRGAAAPASAADNGPSSAVPEPAPWLAMLAGLALLTARRQRR